MKTTYFFKANKLYDFLGLLAVGAAALSISISVAYGDNTKQETKLKPGHQAVEKL